MLALGIAVGLGPTLLFWHLHPRWNPDGSYAYGWAVPMLAAYLFYARWIDRPEAGAAMLGCRSLGILCALAAVPAIWLLEAAPERAICGWSLGFACIGVSAALIGRSGGVPWFRWFSFPLAFVLTAIPWPHASELLVSDFLMRDTTRVTVETLCLIGVPSAQAGNLVHLENGVVDIDEACSGIRSLQAMVMMSLFLGEMFRLTAFRRGGVFLVGIVCTLMANIARTTALSLIASRDGMGAVDSYHDSAGLVSVAVTLATTLAVAYFLRPKIAPPPHPTKTRTTGIAAPRFEFVMIVLLCSAEIAVEGWYRSREAPWPGWKWEVRWPTGRDGFEWKEIPKRTLRLLTCDEARAATWNAADGTKWSLYSVRWNTGNSAAEVAKVHRPDVCLNAEGAVLERDLGRRVFTIGGETFPFQGYLFRLGDQTLYVFFGLAEQAPSGFSANLNPEFEGVDMVQRAAHGVRHASLESLEFAISGCDQEQAAVDACEAQFSELVQTRAGRSEPAHGK